jgi:hypothetical protein
VEVHPEAASAFCKAAEDLVREVKELSPSPRSTCNEFFTDQVITERDILGRVTIGITNPLGQELGKGFFVDQQQFGLFGPAYTAFRRLIGNVQRIPAISEIASETALADITLEWIRRKFCKEESKRYTEFLLPELSQRVSRYQVWIPIPFTSTEIDFEVGNISVRTITKDQITSWKSKYFYKGDSQKQRAQLEMYENELRKKCQGFAAGYFECTAEPLRAAELAYANLGSALSVLRFLSPACHFPEALSGAYEYGRRLAESKYHLLLCENPLSFTESEQLLDKGLNWHIDARQLEMMRRAGLGLLSELLRNRHPNQFQRALISAIAIYSKSTLKRSVSDKLLYTFAGLEAILLKNTTEPIMQNLADRIAFAIAGDKDRRMEIVAIVKAAYALRSAFVHHGTTRVDDLEVVRKFMSHAWTMFISLVQNISRFSTIDECIDAIESIKYS